MRCFGRTGTLRRCKRQAKIIFCHQHRIQFWGILVIIGVIAGLYQDLIKPVVLEISDVSIEIFKPKVAQEIDKTITIDNANGQDPAPKLESDVEPLEEMPVVKTKPTKRKSAQETFRSIVKSYSSLVVGAHDNETVTNEILGPVEITHTILKIVDGGWSFSENDGVYPPLNARLKLTVKEDFQYKFLNKKVELYSPIAMRQIEVASEVLYGHELQYYHLNFSGDREGNWKLLSAQLEKKNRVVSSYEVGDALVPQWPQGR